MSQRTVRKASYRGLVEVDEPEPEAASVLPKNGLNIYSGSVIHLPSRDLQLVPRAPPKSVLMAFKVSVRWENGVVEVREMLRQRFRTRAYQGGTFSPFECFNVPPLCQCR
jgi:hypothetical protein